MKTGFYPPKKIRTGVMSSQNKKDSTILLFWPPLEVQHVLFVCLQHLPYALVYSYMSKALIRVAPFEYLHVLDTNTNVSRLEIGPKTLLCKEHERYDIIFVVARATPV